MDCRNPGYMDVFKLAIHGTGYPLPGRYDELPAYLCITMSALPGNAAVDASTSYLPSTKFQYPAMLERTIKTVLIPILQDAIPYHLFYLPLLGVVIFS
jgi:hypothetical protein